MNIKRIPYRTEDLHPEVRFEFSALTEDLALAYQADRTEFLLEPFEGFRSLDRQRHLLAEGTTKAGPWESAHQFGFAVDFELMRALPRSRFRGAFGEKVTLPVDTAETLERFEKELRSVGLIRKGEVLRQGAKLKSHFRVQILGAEGNTLDVHELSSLKNAHSGPLSGVGERATKLRCSEPKPLHEAVKPNGPPVKGRRCIRVKGGLPPT